MSQQHRSKVCCGQMFPKIRRQIRMSFTAKLLKVLPEIGGVKRYTKLEKVVENEEKKGFLQASQDMEKYKKIMIKIQRDLLIRIAGKPTFKNYITQLEKIDKYIKLSDLQELSQEVAKRQAKQKQMKDTFKAQLQEKFKIKKSNSDLQKLKTVLKKYEKSSHERNKMQKHIKELHGIIVQWKEKQALMFCYKDRYLAKLKQILSEDQNLQALLRQKINKPQNSSRRSPRLVAMETRNHQGLQNHVHNRHCTNLQRTPLSLKQIQIQKINKNLAKVQTTRYTEYIRSDYNYYNISDRLPSIKDLGRNLVTKLAKGTTSETAKGMFSELVNFIDMPFDPRFPEPALGNFDLPIYKKKQGQPRPAPRPASDRRTRIESEDIHLHEPEIVKLVKLDKKEQKSLASSEGQQKRTNQR